MEQVSCPRRWYGRWLLLTILIDDSLKREVESGIYIGESIVGFCPKSIAPRARLRHQWKASLAPLGVRSPCSRPGPRGETEREAGRRHSSTPSMRKSESAHPRLTLITMIAALNSLRYRLGRYPVVARRCLASTALDTVVHQAGRRWHSDSDQPLGSSRPRRAARAGLSEHDRLYHNDWPDSPRRNGRQAAWEQA